MKEGQIYKTLPQIFLRQDPSGLFWSSLVVEPLVVIFFFENSWKIMNNDTTFVRMRSGDHLGDAKC